jgi:hypothetical protein
MAVQNESVSINVCIVPEGHKESQLFLCTKYACNT